MPQDFKGPPKYASPLVHSKKDSTYRDDFISAIYVFAELILSRLPWAGDSKENMGAHKQRVLEGAESLIPELLYVHYFFYCCKFEVVTTYTLFLTFHLPLIPSLLRTCVLEV